jgi:hypothetical protein
MTAQELGNYLSAGLEPIETPSPELDDGAERELSPPLTPFQRLKRDAGQSPKQSLEKMFIRNFKLPIAGDVRLLGERYRKNLHQILLQSTALGCPLLINSVEGVGKSTAVIDILSLKAFDTALNQTDDVQRFAAIAFRSKQQAEQKSLELRKDGYSTIVLLPFWEHLRLACERLGVPSIGRDDFDNLALSVVLKHLKTINRRVYETLEERRQQVWSDARFEGGNTILLMTHKSAEHWAANETMRAWHHPAFDPNNDPQQNADLSGRFQIADMVFDDPEGDEFVHILPEAQ